jgi:hypothetical protein
MSSRIPSVRIQRSLLSSDQKKRRRVNNLFIRSPLDLWFVIHKSPPNIIILFSKTSYSTFQMSDEIENSIARFISVTQCERADAIKILEKHDWKVDRTLNSFYEHGHYRDKSCIHSKHVTAPYQQYEKKQNARAFDLVPLFPRSSSKTIIIPTMIKFQR